MKMNGVVAYIQETADGKTIVTFDDVSSEKQPPTSWCHELLFTSNSYDSDAIRNLDLTKSNTQKLMKI